MSKENFIHHTNGTLIFDSDGHVVSVTPYQWLQLDKMIEINNKLDKQIALLEKMVELLERSTDADY
jgi:hypothetical protein